MATTTTTTPTTTTSLGQKIETPFTSGALRNRSDLEFWKSYVESRPSPTEDFFQLLETYHKSHGNSDTGIAHDVGTGPGNIAARLAAYFDRVVGSDVNEKALAAAPSLIPGEDLSRMSFIQSPAEELAQKTPVQLGGRGTTDVITVSECMPLLDAPKALKAFHTLLRPEGTLAIYFYGPAVFVDGDTDLCNAAYDRVATRICTFNQPMKGTPGFPFHLRGAETLISYLDNIVIPSEDWEGVERYKWNCDYPLIFNSKAGFDFDFEPIDRRGGDEITRNIKDDDFWGADWSIENVKAYFDSVYPNYRDKAGARYAEVETLLEELNAAMGEGTRRVTFPVVLILATKRKPSSDSRLSSTQAGQVRLSPSRLGLGRVNANPAGAIETANSLLQKNHDEFHIFWRDINGHNHMAHSLLTTVALGGGPSALQRAYDDGFQVQRPIPGLQLDVVDNLVEGNLLQMFGQLPQYTNVLVFFEREIDRMGWKTVLQKYCFSRTPLADAILSRLYEGAYHPIIHFGLGVEFEQPSIIAEGLAQAVTHSLSGIPDCLLRTDQEGSESSPDVSSRPLIELYKEARANDVIFRGPRWEDMANKMKDGVLGRSQAAITRLAAQFRVKPSELEQRAAEVVNCGAYIAGAAQRLDKTPKIDFFYMHVVTSSIFLTVLLREPWISVEDKVRLVEWKGRTDLLWYAASGCPDLNVAEIKQYRPGPSAGMGWSELYHAVNAMHDDGHVAKFVRALKSAEEVSEPFEQGNPTTFPMQGPAWLSLARMAYDSTVGLPDEAKWVWGVGFKQAWVNVPQRS